jgi:hypothetical protein
VTSKQRDVGRALLPVFYSSRHTACAVTGSMTPIADGTRSVLVTFVALHEQLLNDPSVDIR